MRARPRRRHLAALVVALVAAVGPARPAAADAARPGNVRSEVTGTTPGIPVQARVVGGDAFLQLTVERGHEVVVLDYVGGDYVRIDADGTVSENRGSAAWRLNRTRYGDGEVDPEATGAADWRVVARDGTWAWHDHRVHWMSPTTAPDTSWTVPLRVDGRAAEILGRYGPVDAPAGWPWWLVVAALAAASALVASRVARPAGALALVAVAVTAPVAVALHRLPAATWAGSALLGAALLAAVGSLATRRPTSGALVAGAGVALALWGLRRVSVFDHAVLVTSLPAWLDRVAVAVALGIGAGLVAGSVWLVTRPPAPTRPPRAPATA